MSDVVRREKTSIGVGLEATLQQNPVSSIVTLHTSLQFTLPRSIMSKLRVESFSISLDGFGAGPRQDLQNPLGIGGTSLHDWAFSTRTFQKNVFGGDGGSTEGVDEAFAARPKRAREVARSPPFRASRRIGLLLRVRLGAGHGDVDRQRRGHRGPLRQVPPGLLTFQFVLRCVERRLAGPIFLDRLNKSFVF